MTTLVIQKVWIAKYEGQTVISYLNQGIAQLQWTLLDNIYQIPTGSLQGIKPPVEDWMEEGSLKQKLLTISLSELSDITNEEITQEVECLET